MTLNGLRKTLLLVAVCEVAIGVTLVLTNGASAGGASGTHPASAPIASAALEATSTTVPTSLPTTLPATATAAPTTLNGGPSTTSGGPTTLSLHGSGSGATGNFSVTHSAWTINYKFDCIAFGNGTGDFSIVLTGLNGTRASDPEPVNEHGRAGRQGSVVMHGAGTYSLAVNTQCNWLVSVVD